LKPVIIS